MSTRGNYKTTEIGEIPSDWEVVDLEKVLELCDSGTWGVGKASQHGGVPILRSTNIKQGRLLLDNVASRVVPADKVERYRLSKGDIIVARSSGSSSLIGDLAYFDLPEQQTFLFSNYAQRLRANRWMSSRFLFYYLSSPKARAKLMKLFDTTTGLKNLSIKTYKRQPVPLPPLPEQQTIASILSTVDDAVQKTDEIIEKTQQLNKGLIQRLLTKGIGPTTLRKTEIGETPEDWDLVELDDILSEPIRNGYSAISPGEKTGKWVLTLSAVSIDGFRPDQVKPAPDKDPNVDRCRLKEGDILVSRSNTRKLVGLSGLYLGTPDNCSYPDLMMRVRINQSRMHLVFLEHWIRHPYTRNYLTSSARGTSGSMVKINRSILSKLLVPLPPLNEQEEIVAKLSSLNQKLTIERDSKQKLQQLKRGLMQILLTGKVRVKVN